MRILAALLLVTCAYGCKGKPRPCPEGKTIQCSCGRLAGSRTCEFDGKWTPCDCSSPVEPKKNEANGLDPFTPADSILDAPIEAVRPIAPTAPRSADDVSAAEEAARSCASLEEVSRAWERLRRSEPEDPWWQGARKASKRLEKCRRRAVKRHLRDSRKAMKELRQEYARMMEVDFLNRGLDIEVSVRGSGGTTLRIKGVLIGRPEAHQFINGPLRGIEKLGFKKVKFTDGWTTWPWTANGVETDRAKALETVALMGLDKPLKLKRPPKANR